MEVEIQELKNEIDLLTKKVELLEKKEKKRRVMYYVKLLLKLAILLFSIYGAYKVYNYLIEEVPNIMEEKIKDILPANTYTYE